MPAKKGAKKAAKKVAAKKTTAKKAVKKKSAKKTAAPKSAPAVTREQIELTSYHIYLERQAKGLPGDSYSDWIAAEQHHGLR